MCITLIMYCYHPLVDYILSTLIINKPAFAYCYLVFMTSFWIWFVYCWIRRFSCVRGARKLALLKFYIFIYGWIRRSSSITNSKFSYHVKHKWAIYIIWIPELRKLEWMCFLVFSFSTHWEKALWASKSCGSWSPKYIEVHICRDWSRGCRHWRLV